MGAGRGEGQGKRNAAGAGGCNRRRKRYTLGMTIMEPPPQERLAGEPMPPLHLDSLVIEGFRGIDLLEIPRLGRVTLLAGKNGIGKTTVLEAVHAYAHNGDPSGLANMLMLRREWAEDVFLPQHNAPVPDWESLFTGRIGGRAEIGPKDAARLVIEDYVLSTDEEIARIMHLTQVTGPQPDSRKALKVTHGQAQYVAPLLPVRGENIYPMKWYSVASDDREIDCELLPPVDIAFSHEIALYQAWDQSIKKNKERLIENAVKLALDSDIEDIHVTGDMNTGGRKIMVKLALHNERVPLHSMGQGPVRLFQIATVLIKNSNGILLIDEAENGLHYTVQRDFWRMVLQTAQDNNVQVLATTHSADCIRGFAEAANENKEVEGVLYRLSRKGGPLRAVEYDEHELAIYAERMAEQYLELR